MTLLEHLRELRSRLFKASLGIAAGMVVGYLVAGWVKAKLEAPYCNIRLEQELHQFHHIPDGYQCPMQYLDPTSAFVLTLQIALWVGLVVAAPIWLYQLWA